MQFRGAYKIFWRSKGGFARTPSNPPSLRAWKPWLINIKRYNSACRHYFQKQPDRIVHLSNLYSATRTDLAYSGVLCSAFTQLSKFLFRAAIYCFSHAIVTCMWPFDHVPYAVWASNWLIDATCGRLGRFPKVSSIICHSFGIGQPSVILQSPNIGFDNFAVIIALAVAAKKQQSNEAEITAKPWAKLVI